MSDQLLLLDPSPPWRLDSPTRERGRRGVAAARAVLRDSQAQSGGAPDEGDHDDAPSYLASAA